MDFEHYEQFDEDDKKSFHKFVDNAIEFLNSLFINKTFKNGYTMKPMTEEKYKDFIKSLEEKNYVVVEVYNNQEQGRPASLEIFRAFKKEEELRIVVSNDWLGEYELSLEYDK